MDGNFLWGLINYIWQEVKDTGFWDRDGEYIPHYTFIDRKELETNEND